ncbi:hypothetical protein Hanom_Chr03g00235361 [Helianthus anomalus]
MRARRASYSSPSEKQLKVTGQTAAPSNSEVDLGVFAKKPGNLLKRIYEASSQPKSMTSVFFQVYSTCFQGYQDCSTYHFCYYSTNISSPHSV